MKWLTKSDYLKFLIHPAYLWLAKHTPNRLPPIDEATQAIFDQGEEIELTARRLFPNAHLIDTDFLDGPAVTAQLLAPGGPEVLFQPSVLTTDKRYARADVFIRQPNDAWDLYEIKSATKVKPEYIPDLAFQRLAFEADGRTINRCFVIHINGHYERIGEIDPAKLFITEDVTAEVEDQLPRTAADISVARSIIEQPACPPDAPELATDWHAWRSVYHHLHPDLPVDSLLGLTRLGVEQLKTFTAAGYRTLAQIPATARDLKPQQRVQIALAKTGRPQIHAPAITRELAGLTFPLHFLDYETFASALPLYDRLRPYQQIPFQYSLHVLTADGQLSHHGFLAQGPQYPVPELLGHLQADFGPAGSVIVWNQDFEMSCNDRMAALHPAFQPFLRGVNARVYDLMSIFARGLYAHPDFHGSASIKKVLPVLIPELSYENLEIGEGLTAQRRWMAAALGQLSAAEAEQVYTNLITYCSQDTLAMVKIYQHLNTLN